MSRELGLRVEVMFLDKIYILFVCFDARANITKQNGKYGSFHFTGHTQTPLVLSISQRLYYINIGALLLYVYVLRYNISLFVHVCSQEHTHDFWKLFGCIWYTLQNTPFNPSLSRWKCCIRWWHGVTFLILINFSPVIEWLAPKEFWLLVGYILWFCWTSWNCERIVHNIIGFSVRAWVV